jgi:hypothetical protein
MAVSAALSGLMTPGLAAGAAVGISVIDGPQASERDDKARLVGAYGQVPLGFEANRGQSDRRVRFLSRGSGYGVFVTQREVVLALGKPGDAAVLRMVPVGASPHARLTASARLSRNVNYLVGRRRAHVRRDVASYGRVTYEGIYRGVDLVLRGNQRALEYDFVVAPGAVPETINLRFDGARSLSIADDGALVIKTPAGEVRHRRPVVYQERHGDRRQIPGAFTLRGNRVGFRVGDYDRSRPLVIDPVIEYSTFLGGTTSYDLAQALALGRDGSAYVAGLTFAADFPTTAGAFDADGHGPTPCAPAENPGFQPPPVEQCRSDAFVTKLDPKGTDLVYSTFLGGAQSDRIQDIDVDAAGAAYVTGGTDSDDFPTTPGAVDRTAAGERRVIGVGLVVFPESFLTKLSPDGSRLEYSTLLGGGDADEGTGVKIGKGGDAYVTGHTYSADYPTTAGAFDVGLNTPGAPSRVCSDIFVTKVGATGSTLGYSTLIGGNRLEFSFGLDVDDDGAAYVTGDSTSDDAPTTPGAFQQRPEHVREGAAEPDCSAPLEQFEEADPLVVKVAPDGSALDYATYFGGSGHEHGTGIAVQNGSAYVVGHTNSPDFPTTDGAFDRKAKGTATLFDGFAAKVAPAGDRLEYSTLLAGAGDDWVFDVDVDERGSAYLTGMTTSTDFPTTKDALDSSYEGPGPPFHDAFLTRLAPDGSGVLYSSYFGGLGPDVGLNVVEDGNGSAYLSGVTFSPDLPASSQGFDPVFGGPPGYSDAFLVKFSGFAAVRQKPEPATRPSRRLSVRPRVARVGERTRFRFRTTVLRDGGRQLVRGALVRFGDRRVRTNAAGRGTIVIRPRSAGRRRASATKAGLRRGHVRVTIRPKQRRRTPSRTETSLAG